MSGNTRFGNGSRWGSAARSDDAPRSEYGLRSEHGPCSAREEAERLVVSVLAVAAAAARSFGGERAPGERASGERRLREGFATGTAECCVCPICQMIAAMRDPDPEFAERVATGAGDLAAGLTSLLRSFGGAAPQTTDGPHATAAQREDGGPDVGADAGGAPNGTGASSGIGSSDETPAGSGAWGAPRTGRPAGGPWPWSEFTWPRADGGDDADDPWRAATQGTGSPSATPPPATKPMAKKAVKPKAAPPSEAPYAE